MSICTTCLQVDPMPKCIDELILVETELEDDTAVTIYFKIHATGVVGYVPGTVIDGKVSATEQIQLPTGQYSQLWFTLETDQPNQRQTFTVDAVEYNCIDVMPYSGSVEIYDLTITDAD
jgi:hypothetical protein